MLQEIRIRIMNNELINLEHRPYHIDNLHVTHNVLWDLRLVCIPYNSKTVCIK